MDQAKLQAVIDRHDIHECLLRFCRSMDRFDRDLYLSAFHPDAELAVGPYVGDAAGCYDWAIPMHDKGQVLTQHCLLNHTIDVDGDTAHSEAMFLFAGRNHPFEPGGGETVMLSGGRYLDRLERRDGEWKIAGRITVIEWSCIQPSLPTPFSDIADIAKNGVSARDRSDPSYQRPLTNHRAPNRP
jgi:hypothetical protein